MHRSMTPAGCSRASGTGFAWWPASSMHRPLPIQAAGQGRGGDDLAEADAGRRSQVHGMDGGRRNAPPSFLGLCEDKRPEDVVREKEAARKRRASVQFSRSKFRFSTMRAPLLVI